ncbi:betaine-aldehyde dehydrogenase [Aureimonas mangrovi]|uniref:betaine-aldehyde dehydrogenase n=1 Tax=Aureimonas mangrovi TaxID=2758041 RepID=UPI00163DD8D4|nr:betaine-aldehyde dehydrogenase [Aureimonas mangrovi]
MNTIDAKLVRQNSVSASEEQRRRQLIEATIAALGEIGFAASSLSEIAGRAGVAPSLVSHYFGDKDGLLEATMRYLAKRVGDAARTRLRDADGPRERIQAIIDANLAPEEFDAHTGGVWLAFWGQALHSARLRRVQDVYQGRTTSNLRQALRQLVGDDDARRIAIGIASLIDGLWLRASLSQDFSGSRAAEARRIATSFAELEIGAAKPRPVEAKPARPAVRSGAPRLTSHVGGRFVEAAGAETFETIDPATGEVLAEVAIAKEAEIDAAVAAAKKGQAVWGAMTGAKRGRILHRVVAIMRERNEELSLLETRDTGKPIQETLVADAASGADCLEYFAGLAAGLSGEQVDLGPSAFGYTRREPLGVVAGIGAWNYPIQIACWKAAPALAAGNAMIFKPAELTPLTAAKLAEIMTEAGVPDGVFNVVQGPASTGRLLSRHPEISKISLTGEVGTGKRVMADAASTLKQVTLELGGKSPLVVFDDASLDDAVGAAMLANFYSAGEICSNGTRVFVHEAVKAVFLEKLSERTRALIVGDPQDARTQIGALISEDHMRKVLSYLDIAKRDGARAIVQGGRVTEGALGKGFFVSPTIYEAGDEMRIAREEIFGPVMSVLSFRDEDEVIERANATEFGLAAGVFTRDMARAHRVIARLHAGTTWINAYNLTPIELPFGGVKRSGIGRENGRAALEAHTRVKSVYVNLGAVDAPY